MAVRVPAVRAQVHLHVSRPGRLVPDLHHRPPKIRPSLDAAKAGMKHANRLAVQSLELIAQQPLVLPHRLQQPLRRRIVIFA